jgi:signal transduction histidine kinase
MGQINVPSIAYHPRTGSKSQISSVQILIEDISKRKHSETQLQQQNRLLETVHEVFRAISTTLDTQQILSTVARATARAVDASSVYVCDWNQEQGTTTVLAEYIGTDASELERKSDLNVTYNLTEDFGDNAAWLQDPKGYALVYLDDPHIAPEQRAHLEQYGAHSALVVTLRMPEKIIGYIEVWESRHKRHFTTEEIEIVKAIAQQAAAMVENAQLYQQVKEQQEYHQVLLEAMPELLFHLNSKGIFIDYRAENKQDLLIQPEHFLNRHYRDVLPLGISQQLATAIDAAIQTHQVQSFEYRMDLAEQTNQMYEARVATTKIGTTIVVSRNITEQKQAEHNRFKLAMEQEKTELLKQFISHLSHDLKTPLSVIRVNLSLLQRIHDPQKQQSRLLTIHQQTQRLERLIQDILTVSRLDHIPGFVFESIDLNQLVNEIAQQLHSLTENKPLAITVELEPDLQAIQADKDELARALINLVENAISYTKQGRITIRTTRQADVIMIEVADTGIGIAEAKLPYIFNHFYRTDEARSNQTGGSGLGLAIVKKIIEGHRGSIDVASTQGVGTTFRITLPAVIDR